MLIVINGGNTTAEYLATYMLEANHRIVIIDEDYENIDRLSSVLPRQVTLVQGDGCDSEVLRDAATGECDLFISLTGKDETNLVACELASIEFGAPRCIASVSSPKNQRIFKEIGIEPVSSTELISRLIEEEAVIGDMHAVFSLRAGSIVMIEQKLPARMKHKEGIVVSELGLSKEIRLVAVAHDDNTEMIDGSTRLMPGETIIAAVKSGSEDEFKSVIRHL